MVLLTDGLRALNGLNVFNGMYVLTYPLSMHNIHDEGPRKRSGKTQWHLSLDSIRAGLLRNLKPSMCA